MSFYKTVGKHYLVEVTWNIRKKKTIQNENEQVCEVMGVGSDVLRCLKESHMSHCRVVLFYPVCSHKSCSVTAGENPNIPDVAAL